MSVRRTRRWRACMALAAVLGTLGPSMALAAPPASADAASESRVDVDALLGAFAKLPGLEARFREEKHLSLLAAPLVNEGVLYFTRGRLARRIDKPRPSVLVVRDGRLSFSDGVRTDHLDLDANPVAAIFVHSFVDLLAGDRAALERSFHLQAAGSVTAGWTLVLTPRVHPLDRAITRIEATGRGTVLHELRVFETNGDRTVTRFTSVDPDRRFTGAERDQLFRVP